MSAARLDDLASYDYELPEELIAQARRPAGTPSRLMVVDRTRERIVVDTMASLPERLQPGDLLVRNDTRVLAARLRAVRTRAQAQGPVAAGELEIEVLLCHPVGAGAWEALVRPAKRVKAGDLLAFPGGIEATVAGIASEGMRRIQFAGDEAAFEAMESSGTMPLPPYVSGDLADPEEYQTSFAKTPGAVAAPTAGFHFREGDFERMRERGVEIVDVTLHVGPGTFLPIRAERLAEHEMHRERYEVRPRARERIETARREGRRIVAMGTTSVRVLESLPGDDTGWTSLFIRPGHVFGYVGAMITNFHLPRTTLLVLVSAFAGRELILEAYRRAVEERFLFYSFGDGMLIV